MVFKMRAVALISLFLLCQLHARKVTGLDLLPYGFSPQTERPLEQKPPFFARQH